MGQTVEPDTGTGLPELPEGLFWRVGEIDEKYGTGGWSSGGRMKPGVSLMRMGDVVKREKIPVYGTRWWNKNTVVSTKTREWTVREPVTVIQRLFTGYSCLPGKVPEIGIEFGGMMSGDRYTSIHYEIPITPEGIKWIADQIWELYQSQMEYKRKIAEEQKYIKENLYGDYPPKKLSELMV